MRRFTLPTVAVLALALSGCGGDGGGLPESTTPADLDALGAKLESGWGVSCDPPMTDGMGLGKVVCSLPPEHQVDGEESIGMAVQSWSDRADVETFRDNFASGFVAGDGWFVNAPTQEAADEAAAVLAG
jgi:hypothetical protein